LPDRFAGKAEWFDAHYRAARGRVRLELVLERLSGALPPPPARILDVGGGTGAFAIPLAGLGHRVTLLEQSAEWLDRARSSASAAEVEIDFVNVRLEALADAALGPFDVILCHAVLMYVDEPKEALASLRSVAAPDAVLSLLEKNRDGIAPRPGLRGDYAEAHRLLTERESIGGLGVANRASSVGEWLAMLRETGWTVEEWAGVRLFSDLAPDDLDAHAYAALLDLERAAGMKDPYRQMSRLVHVTARAVSRAKDRGHG